MPKTEFALLRWLQQRVGTFDHVTGIGDDCCVLHPLGDLLVTVDTLVEGVHFLPGTIPEAIGHKALAVSLSDIAAMGGKPTDFLVSLAMPISDEVWFKSLAEGMLALAERYGIRLVGGDTVQGPLTITTIVHGQITRGHAIKRSGAKVGDDIWVTGTLGGAAAGLMLKQAELEDTNADKILSDEKVATEAQSLIHALDYPDPPVSFAQDLSGLAHAAIDISDGLAADLEHILQASGVGAKVNVNSLPIHSAIPENMRIPLACFGGDDYQLCFTAAPAAKETLLVLTGKHDTALTCIGHISSGGQLSWVNNQGEAVTLEGQGWQHFV